jgi:hypothetical protein
MATIIEHNSETQEIKEIEVDSKLIEQFAKSKADYEAAEATKASAKAELLAKLGITQEEALLLLS